MITHQLRQFEAWQESLRNGFKDTKSLLAYLRITTPDQSIVEQNPFPVRVPHSFVDRIEPNNLNDPLLKQILITQNEFQSIPGYSDDPLLESKQSPIKGLLHKYHDRVLIMTTSACAIHCRFCFRKHFPYESHRLNTENWKVIIDYIGSHSEINEVILSGGDPLMLPDQKIFEIIQALEKIPHLGTIRFHSRIPIVLPNRITKGLLQICETTRLNIVFAIHANHPNELNDEVAQAMFHLKKRGITLLGQSVLLKDINDTVECLEKLSRRLFDCGILPYYLHQPDKIAGTQHFDIDPGVGEGLINQLRERVSGYLVPRFVMEVPYHPSKKILL